MPTSKAEQVLEAIKASLETVPSALVERNSVLPEKVPAGGLIILRDGDPGEPEQALGGFGNIHTCDRHRVCLRQDAGRMGSGWSERSPEIGLAVAARCGTIASI